MNLIQPRKALLDFVKKQHGEQQRKYSDEPYWHHLVRVAEITARYLDEDGPGVEIALCHDLLEDTACTERQLYEQLITLGYPKPDARGITGCVAELTDVFIKDEYPELNRKARKEKEARRLGEMSPLAQSVKYADLIDNSASIAEGNSGFARIWLREAIDILDHMRSGNIRLFIECSYAIRRAEKKLPG